MQSQLFRLTAKILIVLGLFGGVGSSFADDSPPPAPTPAPGK